ncbi:cation diffusion facilitator family transporter [Nocardioides zeae]|uniref:Cation diffusion facilitator family transporter n=1 Tax=Nocardioides imazamoxiresistens TaxID=3231893 RepID=A0ABU3PSV6_9ACTN|nr:cation diffusion facilitator family transporter [Nocardioides zeae]MDT9592259.1 cation diffusion facilitator family transporter [Nocardioides zeae]
MSGSLVTVLVALAANALVAVAKSVAAALTGSASMVAEAAHSWADTGNEVALLAAERRGSRPRDDAHPRGYGRASYLWSLVAAFGLFVAGSVVALWHGGTQLWDELHDTAVPEAPAYTLNYVVLGVAFLLEGFSFLQATRQVRRESRRWHLRPLAFVYRTSDPTLRAVVLEDSSALVGLALAGAGVLAHQLTGDPVYDALGSIAVGLLLGVVALFLIRRNMDYLLGEGVPPRVHDELVRRLSAHPAVDRLTYLHVEFVGPRRIFLVAAVDLTGDDDEPVLARRLRALEAELEQADLVEDAVLTLSAPEEEPVRLRGTAGAAGDAGDAGDAGNLRGGRAR